MTKGGGEPIFSRVRSHFFAGKPPPYPPREFVPTTRWHGTTIAIGLAAQALPTARLAVGEPMAVAI